MKNMQKTMQISTMLIITSFLLQGCGGDVAEPTDQPPTDINVVTNNNTTVENGTEEVSGPPFIIHFVADDYYEDWVNALGKTKDGVIELTDLLFVYHQIDEISESNEVISQIVSDSMDEYTNFVFWTYSPAHFNASIDGDVSSLTALTEDIYEITSATGYSLIVGNAMPGVNNSGAFNDYLHDMYGRVDGKFFVFHFFKAFEKDGSLRADLFSDDDYTINEHGFNRLKGELDFFISALKIKLYK